MILDLYIFVETGLIPIIGLRLNERADGLLEVLYPYDVVLTQSLAVANLIDKQLIMMFGIEAFFYRKALSP